MDIVKNLTNLAVSTSLNAGIGGNFKSRLSGVQRKNKFLLSLYAPISPLNYIPVDPLVVTVVGIPSIEVQSSQRTWNGISYDFPNGKNFGDLTVNIRTWNYVDYRIMFNWVNKTAHTNQAQDVNTTGRVDAKLIPMNYINGTPAIVFSFKGITPKSLGEITYSTEDKELLTFDVTFGIDDFFIL